MTPSIRLLVCCVIIVLASGIGPVASAQDPTVAPEVLPTPVPQAVVPYGPPQGVRPRVRSNIWAPYVYRYALPYIHAYAPPGTAWRVQQDIDRAAAATAVPQPQGHLKIWTGPNGYVYRPFYQAPGALQPSLTPVVPSPPAAAGPVPTPAPRSTRPPESPPAESSAPAEPAAPILAPPANAPAPTIPAPSGPQEF